MRHVSSGVDGVRTTGEASGRSGAVARARDGCLLKGCSSVRLCDLIPPQLLLSCLSQALQRIGLWLKLSVRGD